MLAGMFIVVRLLALVGGPHSDTSQVKELPLVEARTAARPGGPALAVIWSGDGDWASFVSGLARELNRSGVSVVGLKSRSWLTQRPAKNPDLAARDLSRILRVYLADWGGDSVLVVGYSRGADLLPFALSRLPPDLRSRIGLIALISPAINANFDFHWVDLLSNRRRPTDLDLRAEVRKLASFRVVCIYGTEDRSALCPTAEPGLMQIVARDRGHRMDDPEGIGRILLDWWRGQ
jgi:type IV secretory pathway VirJ component